MDAFKKASVLLFDSILCRGVELAIFIRLSHFVQHIEWRTKYEVDDLPKSFKPPPVFEKFQVGGFVGPDREGHPGRTAAEKIAMKYVSNF